MSPRQHAKPPTKRSPNPNRLRPIPGSESETSGVNKSPFNSPGSLSRMAP